MAYCFFVELTTSQMCLSPSLTEQMHHTSKDGSSQARHWKVRCTNRALCCVVFSEKGAFRNRLCDQHYECSPISASSLPLAYGELRFLIFEVRNDGMTHSDHGNGLSILVKAFKSSCSCFCGCLLSDWESAWCYGGNIWRRQKESLHQCRANACLQVFPGPIASLQEQEIIMYFKVLGFGDFAILKENLPHPTIFCLV